MTLDRDRIVDRAYDLLREQGLGALSMRRLAAELGVAPGALYWHVPSKQDLLAEVAERIVAGLPPSGTASDVNASGDAEPAVAAAAALRTALLGVRDGADVVSLALALRPQGLRPVRDLALLFSDRLPRPQAEWAARTLVHFVLGTVAEEQNRAELARAGHLDPWGARASGEAAPAGGVVAPDTDGDALLAFRFGVKAIVAGVIAESA